MTKQLFNEFNNLIKKRLKDIQSGKDEDLIKISQEIYNKEKILNTLLEHEDKLSEKDIKFIKSNKHFLKRLYKLYQKNYYGEYIDIDLILSFINELRTK